MSTLVGVIIGGIITLLLNYYFKERDSYLIALNSAKLIDMTICEQISSLMNFAAFIEDYEKQKLDGKMLFSKYVITPCILSVNNDLLDRLYSYEEIRDYNGSGKIMIALTASQRLYNQLFILFESYNNHLTPDNLQKFINLDDQNPVKIGYLHEIRTIYEGIKYKHSELESLNTKLKNRFDLMCKTIFTQESGLCKSCERFYHSTIKKIIKGQSYKPIEIKNEKIEINNIFNEKNNHPVI